MASPRDTTNPDPIDADPAAHRLTLLSPTAAPADYSTSSPIMDKYTDLVFNNESVLDEAKKSQLFMDVFREHNEGTISDEEAKSLIQMINLSDADKEIFGSVFERLSGEKAPEHVPAMDSPENAMPENPNRLGRFLKSRIARTTYAVATLASVAALGYKFMGNNFSQNKTETIITTHAPATPVTISTETAKKQEAVVQAKVVIAEAKPSTPAIVAPAKPVAPAAPVPPSEPQMAPARPPVAEPKTEPAAPSPAPVAVAAAPAPVAPRVEAPEAPSSITLPISTKNNGHGGKFFDEGKSQETWKELGYNVTTKTDAEGNRSYELKDGQGDTFVVKDSSIEKDQPTVEAKRQ